MLATVKPKNEVINFPTEVFGSSIEQSFKELANEYSIPLNFFGTTALWVLAALSGNMYRTELSEIKCIIYAMLLGPSSLGKTVVYDKLCGDIIAKQDETLRNEYKSAYKAWQDRRNLAKANRSEVFDEPAPMRTIRIATNGTLEAFMKYAETNPAGFGIYFDEGKALYSGGAYAKENNSVDFWNKAWNGKTFNELRVESDRERFVTNPAISILAGMQTERVNEMFNKDTIASGLLNRFLFSSSGYVKLNENQDPFSLKKEVCDDWKMLLRKLFNDGCQYQDQQILIPFSENARLIYQKTANDLTSLSNKLIDSIKDGDESRSSAGYNGKLHAYFKRFIMLCAIIKNPISPVIDEECIYNAQKIYEYYKYEGKKLLVKINNEQTTNLNENELKLLNILPEKFISTEAIDIASKLRLSHGYFGTVFKRKYEKLRYIKQLPDKSYLKL